MATYLTLLIFIIEWKCEMSRNYRESPRYGFVLKDFELWKSHYSCLTFCKSSPSTFREVYGVMANYFGGEMFCKCTRRDEYGRPNTQYSPDVHEWIFNDIFINLRDDRVKSRSCRIDDSKF